MQQIAYFEDHGLDRALRAAANWHFVRLEWGLSNAKNSKEGQAVVAELESLIKVRYDRYWRMAGERVDWYFLAKIAHPFNARICYPFYRVSSAVRRNGLKGFVRKLIARIGGR